MAAAAASSSAVALVCAYALLGPHITRASMRAAGLLTRRLGVGGFLATASCTANARRLAAAITPIVLVVGVLGLQLSAGATVEHQARVQASRAMRADVAVHAGGAGIPHTVVGQLEKVPGVASATGVMHSTITLAHHKSGKPVLDTLPVLGVSPEALPAALDPDVNDGNLHHLAKGTVAVGSDRARSLGIQVGSTVTLRYGDGTNAPLRVAATYRNSLALGDFLLAQDELAPHMTASLNSRILLRLSPGADASAVREAVSQQLAATALNTRVVDHPPAEQLHAHDRGMERLLTSAIMLAIAAFTIIAVLSTLILIAASRSLDVTLLRMAGASRPHLWRMLAIETALVAGIGLLLGTVVAAIPLGAFSASQVHAWPSIPLPQIGLLALVVMVTAAAGSLLPLRRALATRGCLRRPFQGR
ncbi:FtsX-like permease family protein [Streptomyces klenkii]|uniref:ABC transporter permease n=1 Tax=Streptomyces klenkii TaxID=1420899 RepID=UPI0033B9D6AF